MAFSVAPHLDKPSAFSLIQTLPRSSFQSISLRSLEMIAPKAMCSALCALLQSTGAADSSLQASNLEKSDFFQGKLN